MVPTASPLSVHDNIKYGLRDSHDGHCSPLGIHVPPPVLHLKHSLSVVYLESVIYVWYFVRATNAHNMTIPFLRKVSS